MTELLVQQFNRSSFFAVCYYNSLRIVVRGIGMLLITIFVELRVINRKKPKAGR
jgi:hypothetical protein